MNIIKFKELPSTNKYAKENLNVLENFDVILANSQSAGYGQWGRSWIDTGLDNIFMSIILKPKSINKHNDIVRFTAVCLCNILTKYNVSPTIKEPNDILINNKKISGILAETITRGSTSKGIVIGIGINLNTDIQTINKINQPATSLNIEIGHFIDKKLFLQEFLNEFEINYVKYSLGKFNLKKFL